MPSVPYKPMMPKMPMQQFKPPPMPSYQLKFDPWMQQEIGRTEAITQKFKEQRLQDMKEGQARGAALFGEGSLGRLDNTDNKRLVEMFRGRLGGYDSGEYGALRDQMQRNLDRGYEGNKAELMKAQAYGGAAGPAAAAQFANLLKKRERGAAEANQDLFIKNIAEKNAAAERFGMSVKNLQDVDTANMGRAERELLNRFQTEMGYASLGAAERAAASQFSSAIKQQQQAASQSSSGKW